MPPLDDYPETDPPSTYFINVRMRFPGYEREVATNWLEIATDDPIEPALNWARYFLLNNSVGWTVTVSKQADGLPEVCASSSGPRRMEVTVFEYPF